MFDTAHVETADEMMRRASNTSRLLDLCQDYFEISIGYRRPTQPEVQNAVSNIAGAFHPTDPTPEERVQAMMYPLADTSTTIRMVLAHEYVVFQILMNRTGIVDNPSIPMLRYEIRMQDELGEERRFNEAIVRQAALFQTYLRMTQNNYNLNWTDCLKHGQHLITPPRLSDGTEARIKDVYSERSEIGHDWRVYVEPATDQGHLMTYGKGRWVIEELLESELDEIYERYTSDIASNRLPIDFENRKRATATVDLSISNS